MDGLQRLREKLANREKVYSTILCHIAYTGLAELYKNCGMDFILADMEHGSFCPENIGDLAYACRMNDIPLIARVQDCEYHCISKPIDMGCDGVLIPRTESLEQVETAIRSLRFPPVGKKGAGGRALLRKGESVGEFNKNRLLILQIESVKGVDLLDSMLSRYGDEIAAILVGPSDFSLAMGIGLTVNDEMMHHLRRLIGICAKHQKSCGIFMGGDADIRKWHEEGMNLFWVSSDLGMLAQEVSRTRSVIESL